MRNTALTSLILLVLTPACDPGDDAQSLRQQLEFELSEAEVSLAEAIAAAEAAVPGATVIEADFDLEDGQAVYDIELYLDGVEHEVHVSPTDASIVEIEQEALDAGDATEAEAAAALVLASPGWAALIAAAEAEVGGIAFEAEADGEDGLFEVELLAADAIWEVELDGAGAVVDSEIEDDEDWEAEEESEDDDDGDDD